ncbi:MULTISPECIES: hypothetical protein [Actinomycetes]|uniref:Uncharacterized protein n=1 Tax=Luedemannella helvata TaxID=349315 RepID=A0ABP4XJB5_9ACTN|nr:hypothetical protein [Streptomyces virginiae]
MTNTTTHQPTTVYAGPVDCIERECEEFWDDEGEDRPGVNLCSHIAAEQICAACSEPPKEEGGYWQRTVAWPCKHVAPEPEGCHAWQLTPSSHSFIDNTIDKLGVFTKDYWQEVDGKLAVVGLRIGQRPGHVIAFYGDWIIRHPDGGFTIHKGPAEVTA